MTAPVAEAKKIEVYPGANAIAKALSRARNGDTVRIHSGRYRESLEITKRVKVIAAKGKPPVIDGGCKTGVVIAVRKGGVVLRGLTVIGADAGFGSDGFEVDLSGIPGATARDLTVKNSCGGAGYGINVFGSRRVSIVGNTARGFSDSGIYVGGITSTGNGVLKVRGNDAFGNNRGIIVEDSAGGKVVISDNALHNNRIAGEGPPAGLFLHNSDGVLIDANTVNANGRYGIHIDPDSDGNQLTANQVSGNPTDLLNEGSGNCGSQNSFGTVAGNPLTPC